MTLAMEYKSVLDKELAVLERTHNISVERAYLDYYRESSLDELDHSFMEAVESANTSAFVVAVNKIIASIKNFIGGFIRMIENMFSGKENMTAEDYFESPTGKIQFQCDVREIEKAIDQEVLKGRKLIQAISSVTGVSDEEVAKFVDGTTKALKKFTPIVIPAVAAWGIKSAVAKSMKKNEKDVEELGKAAVNNPNPDEKKKHQITKVINAIDSLIGEGVKLNAEFMKQLKKAEKKKKK